VQRGSPQATGDEWVRVARLIRPWGRRGELVGLLLTSHPERFQTLREVVLVGGQAFPEGYRPAELERVWLNRDRYIFKFRGVDTIAAAEELRHAYVCVSEQERFPLPEGEYYITDLIGCQVIMRSTGEPLGRVVDFYEQADSGLLVVEEKGGQELLVPFREAICVEIDLANSRIVVDLPEGLRELNRE